MNNDTITERVLQKKIGANKKNLNSEAVAPEIFEKSKTGQIAPQTTMASSTAQTGQQVAGKVIATPKADSKTTVKIFDMLEQSMNYKQLKKGVNEVMKVLGKHKAEVVIMAANTEPLELLMNLPHMCEENSVPYCFVESSAALGRACGIQR